jgi:hypothetical protein
MINPEELNFGDKLYIVNETNNAFSKRKLTTVIDGVKWFRYDRPDYDYPIDEVVYCGRMDSTFEGEVDLSEYVKTYYYFKNKNGDIFPETDTDFFSGYKGVFLDREAAERFVTLCKLKHE